MSDQEHFPQAILNRVFDSENNALRVSSDGSGSGAVPPGGVGFTWNFDDSTTEGDPGSGNFRFNSGNVATLEYVYISKVDANAVTQYDFLTIATLSDVMIKFYKESDPDTFITCESLYSSRVDETDYYKLGASKISSAGSFFVDGDAIVVSFVPIGSAWNRIVGTVEDNTDLANALNARLKWRSQWLDATSYFVKDTVFNDNASWVCLQEHTSTTDDEPGTGVNEATYWEEMSVAGGGGVDTANSPNANEFARFTDADTIEGRTASEARSDLGLVIGTNVQAYSANLDEYAASGNITLGENTSIILDPALSADGKYTGIVRAGTAGAALAFGDLVYLQASDSRWELADADAASTSGDVILGICVLAAAADGDATTILLYGNVRADTAFPTLTIGAPAYVGITAGDIQTAQPSGTDDVIRRVGFALTADELLFNPSNDYTTHT